MQNYKNHAKLTPIYHVVLTLSLLAYLVFAIINLTHHVHAGDDSLPPYLLVGIGIIFFLFAFIIRSFPLKAQDRVIRAEENFRYYVLTGKPLDQQLTMSQIIALRFAPDTEFPSLVQRTIKENLSSKDIKMAVQNWRADEHRL